MGDSRPYLVILTANDCGHCQKLKPILGKVEENLKKAGDKVNFRHIPLLSMRKAQIDTRTYPADLNNYLNFFPQVILISGDSWNTAMSNPSRQGELNAIVMNAVKEGKTWVPASGTHPTNEVGIPAWVDSTIPLLSSSRGMRSGIKSFTDLPTYHPTVGTEIKCGKVNLHTIRK